MIGSAGRVYLECAVLLTLGFVALWAARRAWMAAGGRGHARAWLRWAWIVLMTTLILPPAARVLPDGVFHAFGWSAGAAPEETVACCGAPGRGTLGAASERPLAFGVPRKVASALPVGGAIALAVLGAAALAAALVRYRALRRHLRALPAMRTLGRVRLCVSDTSGVPYAARTARQAFVVVPTEAVADWPRLRLVVAHELQHHRQGDTVWVHALAALRTAFAWLPAAHGWGRFLSELQEMACDEAVLRRRPARAQAYARAIVRAAANGRGRVWAP
ncbi:MAG TPA: M56 family metallopeptidase, partial [Vicinamibacteria bacterium]